MERLDESRLDEWLMAARNGDQRAFEHIVAALRLPLYRFLVRVSGDAHLAEDLFQDTLLKVTQALPGYAPRGHPRSWVFSIASHLCVDARRRPAPVPADLGQVPATEETGAPSGERATGEQVELARALAELGANQRSVVCLHAYAGLTFREIATIVDAPLGTVLYWMHEATRTLRGKLALGPTGRRVGGKGA